MTSSATVHPDNRGRNPFVARARGPNLPRAWLAGLLRGLAERLHPAPQPGAVRDPRWGRLIMVPGFERLDQPAWQRGDVRVRFRATDPVWLPPGADQIMVGLREHVRRLCVSAHELSMMPLVGRWADVAHNLQLAHSLTDVFADTEIDNSSMWCSPAADYEAANSEVASKHLAAVIVFTLVWTAYECAVDAMTSGGGGKGARGRDLVASVAPGHLPGLREGLLLALELDPGGTDHGHRDMRAMLTRGSLAGVAAEHLRQFRNRSIHGDLPKPDPVDWGPKSEYLADADPRLLRFQANTRLTLLLLQMLAASDLAPGECLEEGVEESCDARRLLLSLHCEAPPSQADDEEPELDLGCELWPEVKRMWR